MNDFYVSTNTCDLKIQSNIANEFLTVNRRLFNIESKVNTSLVCRRIV